MADNEWAEKMEKMESFSAYERRHQPIDYPKNEADPSSKYTDNGVTYQINTLQQAVAELEDAIGKLRNKIQPILYSSPDVADGEAKGLKSDYPLNCGVAMEIEIIRHRVTMLHRAVYETLGEVDL